MLSNCYHPSVFAPTVAGLGDKTTDAGIHVAGGRIDKHWRKVKLRASKIGVAEIVDSPFYRIPNLVMERFNLRSVEFGNWLNERERQEMLYGTAAGLDDMAKVLGVEPRMMGLNGLLGVALGARGRGGMAKAHYEPVPYSIINLTKEKGANSLAHEFAHGLDNVLGYYQNTGSFASDQVYQSVIASSTIPDDPAPALAVYYNIFAAIVWDENGKHTDFYKKLKAIRNNKEYWNSGSEVLARSFETWVSYRLDELKIQNTFLTKELAYFYDHPNKYPDKDILERLDAPFRAFTDYCMTTLRANAPDERISVADTGSRKTAVQTTDKEIPAEFIIVELDTLLTSHNPANFSENKDYPNKCQQRDYTNDKAEQLKVLRGAQGFKPEFVINTTPTATDGTPIVTQWGKKQSYVVLGGNGRTMMIQTVDAMKRFGEYKEYLNRNAHLFGYDKEYIEEQFEKPVLVRKIDAEPERCAYYSNVLNKAFTQSVDTNTEAVSLARQITPEAIEDLARIMEESEAETLSQLWQSIKAQRAIISLMRRARIITDQNQNQFLDRNGDLDDKGKLILERVFLAAILDDTDTIEAARNYTAQILRVAPMLLQTKKLPAEWNIIPLVRDAIRLEYERRAANMPKANFVKQATFERPDGVNGSVIPVWDMLDAGARKFAAFVGSYIQSANNENTGTDSFAFREPVTPDELLSRFATKTAGLSDAGEPQKFSVNDIRTTRYRPISLPTLSVLLGDEVPPNFDMVVWGDKYQGKSSLVLLLADDLALNGKVLLNQAEEQANSASFQKRVQETGVALRGVDITNIQDWNELVRVIDNGQYNYVIVDSLQRMSRYSSQKEMLRWFTDNQGKYGLVFIARKDKYKKATEGYNDWAYDMNIEVEVKAGAAYVHKNRYDDPRQISKRKFRIWK